METVMKLSHLTVLYVVFAVGGCATLPDTFEKIQLGQPLDPSKVTQHAIRRPGTDLDYKGRTEVYPVCLVEKQQQLLPLGMVEWRLYVQTDLDGNVTMARLTKWTLSYWFLVILDDWETRERYLDDDGQAHKASEKRPTHLSDVQGNPPFFIMTVIDFLGPDAFGFEAELADQRKTRPAEFNAGLTPHQSGNR
jgi:hypothetical protein